MLKIKSVCRSLPDISGKHFRTSKASEVAHLCPTSALICRQQCDCSRNFTCILLEMTSAFSFLRILARLMIISAIVVIIIINRLHLLQMNHILELIPRISPPITHGLFLNILIAGIRISRRYDRQIRLSSCLDYLCEFIKATRFGVDLSWSGCKVPLLT